MKEFSSLYYNSDFNYNMEGKKKNERKKGNDFHAHFLRCDIKNSSKHVGSLNTRPQNAN